MRSKLVNIHKLKSKKRIFLRKIKAAYFSYELLQHSEIFYEQQGKTETLQMEILEKTLIKINGKESHIFKNMNIRV